jgi:hypothetical protein
MSVQTRSQLQDSALTITNETTAGANTASRVGGLFDDLADTATLDIERGYASVATATDRSFVTTNNTFVKLLIQTGNNILSTNNFSRVATIAGPSITYTGTLSAAIRVSANLTFSGANGDDYVWAIYKNDVLIGSSEGLITLNHVNGHQVVLETFLIANTNDEFTIYVKSLDGSNTISISSFSFNAHTL